MYGHGREMILRATWLTGAVYVKMTCYEDKLRSPAVSYALSIAALLAAVLLRWALDPLMGDTLPLVTLFGAVAATVWLAGYRTAIIVSVLGYLACAYLFIPPRGRVAFDDVGTVIGAMAYLFTCAIIVGLG